MAKEDASADKATDKAATARAKNLDLAIQAIAKDYGDGAIMRLGEASAVNIASIPTGNLLIDRALGVGGFPKGRIIEIYGPESSGKRPSPSPSSPRPRSVVASPPSSTSSTPSIPPTPVSSG